MNGHGFEERRPVKDHSNIRKQTPLLSGSPLPENVPGASTRYLVLYHGVLEVRLESAS
jgi:hypothetical protein